jgi:hypothetical protein
MVLQSSGQISLANLATEFGDSAPHSLSEFYRGGGLVSNSATNSNVPTSGTISLANFYGAQAAIEFTAEYLVVAGGGGGGQSLPTLPGNNSYGYADGGGGAGGLLTGTFTLNSTKTYTAVIGAGGNVNTNGSASSLTNSTDSAGIASVVGGGYGGYLSNYGGVGGSGGGGQSIAPPANTATTGSFTGGGLGTAGQGYEGANGNAPTTPCDFFFRGACLIVGTMQNWRAGDGGGAGSAGLLSYSSNASNGLAVWGTTYADGGSGARADSGTNITAANTAGGQNTGDGGSGGYSRVNGTAAGAPGGSGVVIIRYPIAYGTAAATTGSPSTYTDATYRYYKFTGSGTLRLS